MDQYLGLLQRTVDQQRADPLPGSLLLLIELYTHPQLGACSVALQTEGRVNTEIGAAMTAGSRFRRGRNSGALAEALARMEPPPALPAPVILNVLNGIARNFLSLNWPVSDEELRTLIQSLLAPPGAR